MKRKLLNNQIWLLSRSAFLRSIRVNHWDAEGQLKQLWEDATKLSKGHYLLTRDRIHIQKNETCALSIIEQYQKIRRIFTGSLALTTWAITAADPQKYCVYYSIDTLMYNIECIYGLIYRVIAGEFTKR